MKWINDNKIKLQITFYWSCLLYLSCRCHLAREKPGEGSREEKNLISLLHAHRLITTRAHKTEEKHGNVVTLFEQIIINGELYSFPHALLIIISLSKLHTQKKKAQTTTIKQLISGCLFAINSINDGDWSKQLIWVISPTKTIIFCELRSASCVCPFFISQ